MLSGGNARVTEMEVYTERAPNYPIAKKTDGSGGQSFVWNTSTDIHKETARVRVKCDRVGSNDAWIVGFWIDKNDWIE